MGPVKRKSNAADLSTAKITTKRLRTDGRHAHSNPAEQKGAPPIPKKGKDSAKSTGSAPISLSANEQPAFPRGGASLLTPIERKQIQAQATRDALREHASSGDLFVTSDKVLDDSENEKITDSITTGSKKKRKKTLKKQRASRPGENDDISARVRVEALSYKVNIYRILRAFCGLMSRTEDSTWVPHSWPNHEHQLA